MSCSVEVSWKSGDANIFNKADVEDNCHKKFNNCDCDAVEIDGCNCEHLHSKEYDDVKRRNRKNADSKSRKNSQNNDRKSWQIMSGSNYRDEMGGDHVLTGDQRVDKNLAGVVNFSNFQPVKHSSPVDPNCTVHGYACRNYRETDVNHSTVPCNESIDSSDACTNISFTSNKVGTGLSHQEVSLPSHAQNAAQVSTVPILFKTVTTPTVAAHSCITNSPILASAVKSSLSSASVLSSGVKPAKLSSASSIPVASASSKIASNSQATVIRSSNATANRQNGPKVSTSSAKKAAPPLAPAIQSTGFRHTSILNCPTVPTRPCAASSASQSNVTCPRNLSHGQRLRCSESVIDPDDSARTACRLSRGEAASASGQEKITDACCSAGPQVHQCHGALSGLAVCPESISIVGRMRRNSAKDDDEKNPNDSVPNYRSMLNSRSVNRLAKCSFGNDVTTRAKTNLQAGCNIHGEEGTVVKHVAEKNTNSTATVFESCDQPKRNYNSDIEAVGRTCLDNDNDSNKEQANCTQVSPKSLNSILDKRSVNVGDIVRCFEKNASIRVATKIKSKESPCNTHLSHRKGPNGNKGNSLEFRNSNEHLVETHSVSHKAGNAVAPPAKNSSVKVSAVLAGNSKTFPFARSGNSNSRVIFSSELKRKSIAAAGSLKKCNGTLNQSVDKLSSTRDRSQQNSTRGQISELSDIGENGGAFQVYVAKNNDIAKLSTSASCRGDSEVHGHHCSVSSASMAEYSGNLRVKYQPHEGGAPHSLEANSKVICSRPETMSLKRRSKPWNSPPGDGCDRPPGKECSEETSMDSVRGAIAKNTNTYPVVRARCRQTCNLVTTKQPKAGAPSMLEKAAIERTSFNQSIACRNVKSSGTSLSTPEDSPQLTESPQEGPSFSDLSERSGVIYYHGSGAEFVLHRSCDDTSTHDCRECECDYDGVLHHDWQSEASSTCTERWNSRSNSSDYEEIGDFDGDSTGWSSSAQTEEGLTCLPDGAHEAENEDCLASSGNKFESAGGGGNDGDCGMSGGRRIWACCGGGGVMPGGGGGGVVGGAYGGPRTNVFMDEDSPTVVRRSTGGFSETSGLVGLRNIGNTCFLNSVTQCLSNTRCLLEYLVKEGYSGDINTSLSTMKGDLIRAFGNLISEMWTEGDSNRALNTGPFKTQIQKFAPTFTGYQQHDAQEFLRKLLEGLHEDVNRVTVRPRPIHTDIDDDLSDDQKAMESWKRYLRFDDSKIVDMFVGQLKSSLQCSYCSHTSVTFDPFWDLSLPIPSKSGNVRLNQCLDLFTKEEVMDGDERPTCSKCKERRKMTKSFSIQKFPKVLVLHLKRFSPTERWRGKLSCTVEFPVEGLDLSRYASSSRSSSSYNLIGVANHSGTTYSGHYTAFCRHPYSLQWHEYNDSRVTPIPARRVCSPEAYVLFYELGAGSKL